MLLDMGRDFCKAMAQYSEPDVSYYKQILSEIQYSSDMQDNNHNMGFHDITNHNEKPTGRYGKSTKGASKARVKENE